MEISVEGSGERKAVNFDGSEHVWGAEENKHTFTIKVTVQGAHTAPYEDPDYVPFQVVERAFNLREAVAQAAQRPFGDWFAKQVEAERNEDHERALRDLNAMTVESIQQYAQDERNNGLSPAEDAALRENLLAELVKASKERMKVYFEPAPETTERDLLEAAQAKLVSIKVALNRVSVYQDMVDRSPTEMLVDDLVRDHEELEARIDAVLHYLSSERQSRNETVTDEEVARLLRGGTRVPDSPEGLTDD